ncbi:shikimate kinase [Kribbella amoyensis]|uniref:Shikimate kinase n=1 Tax=Kribbella amoyensis TaxID=996641 RepID=A0A561BT17_9ACTN|nr:AAA family ATPase [Kribbella amoyensis]TWD82006.1 shikimate kinase [Kribbella amoyensis]
MRRVLVTGMSGVGKSTVIERLAADGHTAVDLDDAEWSEWVDVEDDDGPSPEKAGQDWVWRADRVRELLARPIERPLFVSGCAANMGQFVPSFDAVVLLSAPKDVMVERLTTRTTNVYGKDPAEVARSLEFKDTVEPLLREVATVEIDTRAPVDEVVAVVVRSADAG